MEKTHKLIDGFTLTEALISLLILIVVITSTVAALIVNLSVTSYSKHRIQAMYLAKQTLEDLRKHSFSDIANYAQQPLHGTGAVCIDVVDYNNATCGFQGNRIVTISTYPADSYRIRAQVEISWTENIAGVAMSMQEYCTTDIANETIIN